MLRRLLASRGMLSVALIAVLTAATVIGFRLVKSTPDMGSYCALMPDTIGLYTGSDVTILGLPVGTVTKITPQGIVARVDFEIPRSRKLPQDVGAVTVSDSLVADRRLAVIGAEPVGPSWSPEQCITKTLTPKSLTQTFTALAELADQLNGADDPAHPDVIKNGLVTLDRTTAGHGDEINEIVRKLGSALNSPDAAIVNIGTLIDTLGALAHSANNNWGDIKTTLSRLAPIATFIADALAEVTNIVSPLDNLLPQANDLTVMFGGPLLRQLDAQPNLPEMISAGVASLREVINRIPTIVHAFTDNVDPRTGRVALTYAPPRVAIPEPDAVQVCSSINAIAPGRCNDGSDGLVHVQLLPLVLASIGAR